MDYIADMSIAQFYSPAVSRLKSRVLAVGVSALLTTAAVSNSARGGYELELVADNLNKPLYATHAPGDANGLYIIQQRDAGSGAGLHTGTIVRHDLVAGTRAPYLQVSNLDADTQGGLHSLAFHPDYQPSVPGSKLYLIAIESSDENLIANNTLQEWALDETGAPQYSRTLLQFPGLAFNDATHAMDWIGFRPGAMGAERDYLYMSVGDGGIQANSPNFVNHPQDLNSLRGKVLRLDVSGVDHYPQDDDRNYGLTPTIYFGDDETFSGPTAAEVYYSGLRNPWRMSFDRETGDVWIADVGFVSREEINVVPAGVMGYGDDGQAVEPGAGAAVGIDFGWPRREGFIGGAWSGGTDIDPDNGRGIRPDSINPLDDFTRSGAPDALQSITGGYVYRGPIQHPAMQGKYFFAGFDFPTPKVLVGSLDDGGQFQVDVITAELAASIAAMGLDIDQLSSFGEDAEGNLYILDFGDECFNGCTDETGWQGVLTQFGTGQVFRIIYTADPATGDFNSDGTVGAADYTVWRDTMGSMSDLRADGNLNGEIDPGDYVVWKTQFGGGDGGAATIVPEPSGLVAASITLLFACCSAAARYRPYVRFAVARRQRNDILLIPIETLSVARARASMALLTVSNLLCSSHMLTAPCRVA